MGNVRVHFICCTNIFSPSWIGDLWFSSLRSPLKSKGYKTVTSHLFRLWLTLQPLHTLQIPRHIKGTLGSETVFQPQPSIVVHFLFDQDSWTCGWWTHIDIVLIVLILLRTSAKDRNLFWFPKLFFLERLPPNNFHLIKYNPGCHYRIWPEQQQPWYSKFSHPPPLLAPSSLKYSTCKFFFFFKSKLLSTVSSLRRRSGLDCLEFFLGDSYVILLRPRSGHWPLDSTPRSKKKNQTGKLCIAWKDQRNAVHRTFS